MATEYKLSYTGAEIDEKLGMVDTLSEEKVNHETRITALEESSISDDLTDEEKLQTRQKINAVGYELTASRNIAAVEWKLAKLDREGVYTALTEASAMGGNTATEEYIPVEANTAYTVSCSSVGTVAGTITLYFHQHKADKSHIQYTSHTLSASATLTITTEAEAAFIRVSAYESGELWTNVAPQNFQIEKGSTATEYVEPGDIIAPDDIMQTLINQMSVPDNSVTIDKLGDDVVNKSKNVFEGEWENAKYESDGTITAQTNRVHLSVRPTTPVTGGVTYAISWGDIPALADETVEMYFYIHQFAEDGTIITYNTMSARDYSKLLTMNADTTHLGFMIWRRGTGTTLADITPAWMQVEEGSEVTPYVEGDTIRPELIDVVPISEKVVPIVVEEVKADLENDQISTTVKTIAHRGDDRNAPQCTAAAYIVARKHGHTIAENDVMYTEDGQLIVWHDTTLGRLGDLVDLNGYLMYTDGTNYFWVDPDTNGVYTYDTDYVASDVDLSTLTRCVGSAYGANSTWGAIGLNFDVLRRIDFGAWYGEKFKGSQVLTFEEWILLCKQLGMEVYIDTKLSYTEENIAEMANIVKKYGMGDCTSWLGMGNIGNITKLREIIPDARVGILAHPNETTIETYASVNTGRGFFFNGNAKEGMTPEAIQLGLNAGYDVEVWYVDYGTATEETILAKIREAVACGVTAVTTDHYRVDEAFKYLLEQY